MRLRTLLVTLTVVLGSFCIDSPIHADDEAITKAVAAAEAWLQHVDRGEFAESWKTAAVLFRQAVPKEKWLAKIRAARAPLGDAEVGREYVVIQFKTVFEEAAFAVETVTPMKDPDGEWRVSGYYIK